MDIKELRKQALEALMAEDNGPKRGRQARTAKRIGKSEAQLSQWLSGYRTIEDETARDIERAAKKPRWWMDGRPEEPQQPALVIAREPDPASAPAIALDQALPVVLQALKTAPEPVREELAQVLALLTRSGSDHYAQRATELLTQPMAQRGKAAA